MARAGEPGAAKFATAVSTPGNAQYHHYLSPAAYTARFGASRAEASRVESWLRGAGFTAVHADSQRAYVRATAAVSKINAAFRTRIETYKSSAAVNAGPYVLRANSRPLTIPASLASSVTGVTGLDNAAPNLPLEYQNTEPTGDTGGVSHAASSTRCSHFYGQHITSGLPRQFGVTSFPTEVCGYSGTQLREVYGANSTNIGTGQTIALVELGLAKDMFLTLQDYASANGVPAPSPERYAELSLGQGSACGDPFAGEEQLDVEASYDMAPGASQLVVGGDSCNDGDDFLQGLFNADEAILDGAGGHPLATAASNSWGGLESQPAMLTKIEHNYLLRAAGEGVGMYFSAGGGPVRSVPDIAADADPYTGFAVGLLRFIHGLPEYHQRDIGGTSESSPLVAGMVIAAQQGQPAPFGFVDPALYALAGTSAYYDTGPLTPQSPALWRGTFCVVTTCGESVLTTFDDQSPKMIGYAGQVTLPGYDNMSGVGVPNGQDFITGLRGTAG